MLFKLSLKPRSKDAMNEYRAFWLLISILFFVLVGEFL